MVLRPAPLNIVLYLRLRTEVIGEFFSLTEYDLFIIRVRVSIDIWLWSHNQIEFDNQNVIKLLYLLNS